MRMCWINDCNINNQEPAQCCFDCGDKDICPDRCPNRQPCNGVITDDSKGILKTDNQDKTRDSRA